MKTNTKYFNLITLVNVHFCSEQPKVKYPHTLLFNSNKFIDRWYYVMLVLGFGLYLAPSTVVSKLCYVGLKPTKQHVQTSANLSIGQILAYCWKLKFSLRNCLKVAMSWFDLLIFHVGIILLCLSIIKYYSLGCCVASLASNSLHIGSQGAER